jgi:YbbR domain-containing protein
MKKQTHNRIWDSKLLYLIVALFASFFLWVYVTSVEKVEIEETFNNIPVVFYGADTIKDTKGLVLTESSETTVTIKLRGQRTVLSKLKDKKDEISAVIDVAESRSLSTTARRIPSLIPTVST